MAGGPQQASIIGESLRNLFSWH